MKSLREYINIIESAQMFKPADPKPTINDRPDMSLSEDDLEEVSRRDFLKGVGATAGAMAIGAKPGVAKAGNVTQLTKEDYQTIYNYLWLYQLLRYYPVGTTQYAGDHLRIAIDKFIKDYGTNGKELLNQIMRKVQKELDSMPDKQLKDLANATYKNINYRSEIEKKFWSLTDTF